MHAFELSSANQRTRVPERDVPQPPRDRPEVVDRPDQVSITRALDQQPHALALAIVLFDEGPIGGHPPLQRSDDLRPQSDPRSRLTSARARWRTPGRNRPTTLCP